jgi:hypothetical protein
MPRWVTQDSPLRWHRSSGRLQQIWVDLDSGSREWRDVPSDDNDAPLPPVPPLKAELAKLAPDRG